MNVSRLMAVTFLLVTATSAFSAQQQRLNGQAKPSKSVPDSQTANPTRVRITSRQPLLVNMRSKNAPLSEIAAELGAKLNIAISLSPLMQKQRVTVEFDGLPLEGALRLLAPHPYVDYIVNGDSASASKPIAIYLYALNEEPPSTSIALKNNAQTIVVEGNTETINETPAAGVGPDEVKPLKVSLKDGTLLITARRQPLSAVLYDLASAVGIPLEVQYESNALIDLNYKGGSLEDAVRTSLPASVRLYTRVDLMTFKSRPLLITLVAPAKSL
jgi:hypothetical protein